jgi:hypothetical protein
VTRRVLATTRDLADAAWNALRGWTLVPWAAAGLLVEACRPPWRRAAR